MTFHEAIPQKIAIPQKEPILRVGIVLEGDERKTLSLTLRGFSYRIEGTELSFPAGASIEARITDDGKEAELIYQGKVIHHASRVRLNPSQSAPLSQGSGLEISPMRVGRGFHWSKDTTLAFPGIVELLPGKKNLLAINEINFELYLACVVCSEMGAECPKAFMQAQAVCARSWAYVFLSNKHPGEPYQICNDDDCQRYQGTTFLQPQLEKVVAQCRGMFLTTRDSHVLPSYYAKCCGGHSDIPEEIFGFPVEGISAVPDVKGAFPYDLRSPEGFARWLDSGTQGIFCSPEFIPQESLARYLGAVDLSQDYCRWSYEISEKSIAENLREKFGVSDAVGVTEILIGNRSISGRITSLEISYLTDRGAIARIIIPSQYEIRRALHQSFLLSSAFLVKKQGEKFLFRGAGWGHGIGLCQMGGVGMALSGKSTEEILAHYFPEATLIHGY